VINVMGDRGDGLMAMTPVITETPEPATGDLDFEDGDFTDEELTALALAADPDAPLAADAVPLDLYPEQSLGLYPEQSLGLLPQWYMPPVMARGSKGWRTPVVMAIVVSFLIVDVFGLCITFGQLVAA
jgi:hypothetical protein